MGGQLKPFGNQTKLVYVIVLYKRQEQNIGSRNFEQWNSLKITKILYSIICTPILNLVLLLSLELFSEAKYDGHDIYGSFSPAATASGPVRKHW